MQPIDFFFLLQRRRFDFKKKLTRSKPGIRALNRAGSENYAMRLCQLYCMAENHITSPFNTRKKGTNCFLYLCLSVDDFLMLFRNIEWNDGNEIESFVFTLCVFGFQRMK